MCVVSMAGTACKTMIIWLVLNNRPAAALQLIICLLFCSREYSGKKSEYYVLRASLSQSWHVTSQQQLNGRLLKQASELKLDLKPQQRWSSTRRVVNCWSYIVWASD